MAYVVKITSKNAWYEMLLAHQEQFEFSDVETLDLSSLLHNKLKSEVSASEK